VPEGLDRLRQVDEPGLEARLADVERLHRGEGLGVLRQQVRHAVQQPAPLDAVEPAPLPRLQRGPAGGDGAVDVVRAGLGDVGDGLLGGRVENLEGLAAAVLPLAVDMGKQRDGTGHVQGFCACHHVR
jgi:hypothetical protein